MIFQEKNLKSFDFLLLFLVVALSVIGIILVGSATKVNVTGVSNTADKQKILLMCGFILLFIASFLDLDFLCRFYIPIYILNVLLLLFVLLFAADDGTNVNRWIGIGSFGIQPSEFSKIFMILFMAKIIDKNQENINNYKTLLILAILILIPVFLIYEQPSLSAAIVVGMVSCIMMFLGGVKYDIILILCAVALIFVSFVYVDAHLENHIIIDKILQPYQIERIVGTSTDQTGYSIQAIASGQLIGKGLYNGEVNQLNYLSESHTDFIFSVLSEEFGFIGSVGVLFITLIIVIKCMYTATKASTNIGKLICAGTGAMIGFQSFLHVGVGIGILTNTGVAYPFLSNGGSSLWINMIAIGFVLNVGMTQKSQNSQF